ncbi:glycosyl hydrolase family 28-related protein [Parabacteroides johnsonii]|jgi:dienelactone hydrolase|nr:glycosyl hydrolase family 28-related protein [Parabacteroides johnsonii]UEA91590.1 dienelactone hydrolase family protein [Parabacteroides johnsonii]UWP43743.1 dienelactone hydrolase family protein [Parabacteroides johnsonii DSM 18315]
MYKINFLLLLLLSVLNGIYAQQKPMVFNHNETALPGDAFNVQGSGWSKNVELWGTVVKGNENSLSPSFPIKMISADEGCVTGVFPLEMSYRKNVLIAVWVKEGELYSEPFFLNRSRAVTIEFEEVMPGYVFRIFGRNLSLPGCKPIVTFIHPNSKQQHQAVVVKAEPYVLTVQAPFDLEAGTHYQVMVNNGAGGAYGNSLAEERLFAREKSEDPFSLQVPWGSDFVFYKNVYNVRTDSRLKHLAKGDGISNDRISLQDAIDKAHAAGGGVVYLPAGVYKLVFDKGCGLVMRSNVVLKGEGPEQTIIQYGFGIPPSYPDPIGVGGWPDYTNEGVAFLWPLHTKLSGLSDLKVQNVNESGLWRHSMKTICPLNKAKGASGSCFFAVNCHFDLSVAWGISWGYVDKMLIANCNFRSYANITWPWMWHCDGSTNFVIRNNRVFYSAGRFGFSNSFNGIIENNHITRMGDLQAFKGETGGFNIDFSKDMVVMNNLLDVEGDSIVDRNMGETILSQGGNPIGQSLGRVEKASEFSVTDRTQNWNQLRTSDLSTCSVVAIIKGKGAGQWRRIKKNDKHTIWIERPWAVIPDESSNYVVTNWSAEDWLVKGNILKENNRGIWFYCGGTDIAIVENQLNNSEGIYLRSDQRVEVGRYNLMWNAVVEGNTVIRTGKKRPAAICSVLAIQKNDTLTGIGSLGIEFRRNTIISSRPNVSSFIPGEGYWNEVRSTTMDALNHVKGIVGTVFDGNTSINMDYAYRLSERGVTQTVIKDPMDKNAGRLTNIIIEDGNSARLFKTSEVKEVDPFAPYLGKSPSLHMHLGSEVQNGVIIDKVVFNSREYKTNTGIDSTKIFAAIARPERPGRYPGLLVLHGGGGAAEVEKAKKWATKGYVVVTVDEPGVANTDNTPNSKGPWNNLKYGENRFIVKPDITSSTIFDAVLASLQGLYLLKEQPDVIPDKIGVVGISWGGYLTTMISGLAGSSVAASFSVFGSGFYDASTVFLKELDTMDPFHKATWLRWLDAGRRAYCIQNPFFIAAATNDNWFYPQAVKNTLQHISAPVNHVFSQNVSHKIDLPGGTENKKESSPGWTEMEEVYFDYYLKGNGKRFPKIKTIKAEKRGTSFVCVSFVVDSDTPIRQATVNYAFVGEVPTKRKWMTVSAKCIKKNHYEVLIPLQNLGKNAVEFYGTVSDNRPVSVSSNMIWYSN